jgi:hypothetical protein
LILDKKMVQDTFSLFDIDAKKPLPAARTDKGCFYNDLIFT